MPNSFRNETLRDEIAKIVQIAHVDKLTSEQTADLVVACVEREHERLLGVLREIANEDFRGNRSPAAIKAYAALKR